MQNLFHRMACYKNASLLIGLCILMMGLVACKKNPQLPSNRIQETSTAEDMLKLNKLLAEVELQDIQEYLSNQKILLQKDSIGFWYAVIKEGNGNLLKKGMGIELAYSMELLDGTICYTSKEKGKKSLVVGKNEVERGLDLALERLTENSESIVVVPSHLAFGALGNQNCIPPRSPVVYRIYSLKIR